MPKGSSAVRHSSAKILRRPENTNSVMKSEAGSAHEAAIVRSEVLKEVLLKIKTFSNVTKYSIIR
jgi:ribosomal protein S25